MKLGLAVSLLLVASSAHAAPVTATVVDGVTLAPVPTATVTVGTRVLHADEAGTLTLDLERATDVIAKAPGYPDATQTVSPTGDALILLFPPGALEVIEVRAQAPQSASSGSYALSRDEVRNLPGGATDALAAVRSLPGITYAPPIAGGRLVIRGGAPQDSLLTVDGVPVPFLYHSFDNTTIVPVGMIGSIRYQPGGFGVDEGRATSGSVAIGTADEQPIAPTATGTLSMLDVSAAGAVPLGHGVSVAGGVRRSTVDLLLPLTEPSVHDLMIAFTVPPRFHDGQLRLDWQATARDRLTLFGLTSYDRAGVVNHMPDSDLPSDLDLTAQFGRVIGSWKHETATTRNRAVAAVGIGSVHSVFDTIQHLDDQEKLALVRDDLSVQLGDRFRWYAGGIAQRSHHDLDAQSIVIPTDGLPPGHFDELPIHTIKDSYDTSYAGAYTAAAVKPTDSTTIDGGVRVDHFTRIGATVFEPRVEIAQRAGQMTLRASAGRYARDLSEVQGLATYLKPELATQVAGGTDIALAPGLTASATVYHTARSQLAVDDPMPTDGIPGYTSSGRGSSAGVDLLLRLSRDNLFGWIAYSFGKSQRSDRPGEAVHATPFDQTHALTAVGSYQTGHWRFGTRVSYASGLPYTDVVGATFDEQLQRFLPVLGTPYGVRYPDVVQLDLRIEHEWKTKHVDLAAFIDFGNVFRQAHVHRYQYNADFSTKEPLTEYVPLPSIGIRGEI